VHSHDFRWRQDTAGTVEYIQYDSGRLTEVIHLHDQDRFHALRRAQFAHVEQHGFLKVPFGASRGRRRWVVSLFRTRTVKFTD
jgi:hypothetical protein